MASVGAAVSGAIAHVGPNMPLDLLRATGRHAGPLAFDPDRPTPTADGWIESKFAPWTRSILEAWAGGDYDGLGHVVFSRADDSAQRLYYYLCELQRRGLVAGPEPLILDIAKVPRASSIARTEACLRQLAVRLGVDRQVLAASLADGNAERTRTDAKAGGPRCLFAGTPPPDRRLHDVAEQAGFVAIGPTLQELWCDPGVPVAAAPADPFPALAEAIHADPAGPRSFADAGAALAQAIGDSGTRAVVLWQTEEDEAQAWHLPAQRAALAASGVPALVLTRRDWLARDGAREEIAAFLTEIPR
jgi:hypothetical protein